MVVSSAVEGLSLIGGRPALDFTNTEGGERNGPPERIGSYDDLVAWSQYVGVLDAGGADRLAARAGAEPDAATAVLERGVVLREALYRIFSAVVAGEAPSRSDREVLDRELAEAQVRRRLVPVDDGFEWSFESDDDPLDLPLWLLVDDAADLLTSPLLARVKECRGDACTWLFVDESRNRSRRWCEMGECGNRAKARRYRRRHSG